MIRARQKIAAVAGAVRLGREAGRAAPQEVESGEDDVEDDRADRDAADQRGVAEPADDGGVDEPDQRRREIGERHRRGDGEHAAVRHLERPDIAMERQGSAHP
jgi:hypothetical protein